MNRRGFLNLATTLPMVVAAYPTVLNAADRPLITRVRPGDAAWPSAARWDGLGKQVGGRLLKVESPLAMCRSAPTSAACAEHFMRLRNPYYIGDHPALTQTSGWLDAWASSPSVYAVAAAATADVVAAVNFARNHSLRLVVKGGGHSYHGTSNCADSLLIWTRKMNRIESHDAFVPQGCANTAPQPAVSVGAGSIWAHVYDAVTTRAGRYVQGGGCATVGVAGLVQSGGFGSFSKNYGLAAAGLLEAEVVTADGAVRIANACTNPELFWGLKGGGGGNLGVVTRLTLRTRELPEFFGAVFGTVRASSESAYRRLVTRVLSFYREQLFNPHWGEQLRFEPGRVFDIGMMFQGLTRDEAQEIWAIFAQWIADAPQDFSWTKPLSVMAIPARRMWDGAAIRQAAPDAIAFDDRPGASPLNFAWAGDLGETGWFLHGYQSAWLPASLLYAANDALADALCEATRHWSVSLHCNKGLAGAPVAERAAVRDTAMNPAVVDAFALAILGGSSPPAFSGVQGHEPDLARGRRDAEAIARATQALSAIAPDTGAYVSESDFFQSEWQRAYWGANYSRLVAVKRRYDPDGLFFVHHGAGGERWSADGFRELRRQ